MTDESAISREVALMRQMRRCSHLLYHKFSLNFSQNQMQIQPGSLSEVLSKVEGAGLVERRRCEDDRRNFEIRLTEEGVKQAEAFERDRQDMAELLFETLDEQEKETLSGILAKLHDHWNVCTFERRNTNE